MRNEGISALRFSRAFLLEHLPEPMSAADAHLQIYDRYPPGSRLRIRSVREPSTGRWTRFLSKRVPVGDDPMQWNVAEISLDDAEFRLFESLPGREIRKNRYFHDVGGLSVAFDVFLGDLRGLTMAWVHSDVREALIGFEMPYAAIEVTGDPFFDGSSLVLRNFLEVRREAERLVG